MLNNPLITIFAGLIPLCYDMRTMAVATALADVPVMAPVSALCPLSLSTLVFYSLLDHCLH